MVTAKLSKDRATASLDLPGGGSAELDAAGVSQLIEELVALRARMAPPLSGSYVPGETPAHVLDNLLWSVGPDPSRRGLNIGVFNPGLGWSALRLSRAQVEDLQTGIEFALAELTRLQGQQNIPYRDRPAPQPSDLPAPRPAPARRTGTRG